MKRKGFLLSLISILLIVAAIVGMVVMVKNIDGVFKEESNKTNSGSKDDTNNSTDKDNTGSGSQGEDDDEVLKTDYYLNEATGTGYCVIGNTTYFFMKVEDYYADYTFGSGVTEEVHYQYFSIGYNNVKKFSAYEVNLMYSFDLIDWFKIDETTNGNGIYSNQLLDEHIYICYTTMVGCNSPGTVLEDLNQNVFCNPFYFQYNLDFGIG